MDIIIIVIELTDGRVRTLRDLAEYVKGNVNVQSYDVYSQPGLFSGKRTMEGEVGGAATLAGCMRVLTDMIGLTESQAQRAISALEDAGFIRVNRELFVDLDTGKRHRLVQFLV